MSFPHSAEVHTGANCCEKVVAVFLYVCDNRPSLFGERQLHDPLIVGGTQLVREIR